MECRILQVVVVQRDEDGEREQGQGEQQREKASPGIREGSVAHQAGGVNHGELVDELHGIFESCVEEEAAGADEEVADEADEEDGVMAVGTAAAYALVGEVDEEEIGEGVYDLGGVRGCVIVLHMIFVY